MKTIINKEVKIKGVDGTLMLRSNLLNIVTNNPPERGLPIAAMKERMRILDALEICTKGDVGATAATGFKASDIQLEDADFNTLKKLFDEYGWLTPHKDIIELADHLDELSKTK
jgi:hypothetical protein